MEQKTPIDKAQPCTEDHHDAHGSGRQNMREQGDAQEPADLAGKVSHRKR
jgi:hypothetical protein